MNWLNTDVRRIQNNLLRLTCLILTCTFPLVCCQIAEDANNRVDLGNVKSIDVFSKSNRTPWPYASRRPRLVKKQTFNIEDVEEYNGVLPHKKDAIHERTRIQEKHKRRLRNRNKHRSFQYQGNLPPHNRTNLKNVYLNYLESEKKYFDYFPVEDIEEKYRPLKDDESMRVLLLVDDNNAKKIVLEEKLLENEKNQKYRRFRREISNQENHSGINYNYVRNFLANEQRNKPAELVLPSENKINQDNPQYLYDSSNDPWNNRFTRPLNDFYLPIPRRASTGNIGYIKYPIPGIYYNAVSPSGTYSVIRRQQGIPSFDNRFGADEDRVIWEVRPYNDGRGASAPGQMTTTRRPTTSRPTTSRPATRRPVPPLIHESNRESSGKAPQTPLRTTTARPSTNPGFKSNEQGRPSMTTRRPAGTMPPPTSPTSPPSRNQGRLEPTKCVWGIVTCCARNNLEVRYNCFEQMGCHGAFWGFNPCADEYQEAALQQAENFFE